MDKTNKKMQIGVIGSAGAEEYSYAKPDINMYKAAEQLGKALAQRGCILITGGKGGVMEASSKGAKQAGGITAAEVSGLERGSGNPYVDVEVVTGDVAFRGPSQLVGMCDGLIALGGGAGTLQELCVAYRMGKPVVLFIGFGGWADRLAQLDYLDERRTVKFETAKTVPQAIKKLYNLLQSNLN